MFILLFLQCLLALEVTLVLLWLSYVPISTLIWYIDFGTIHDPAPWFIDAVAGRAADYIASPSFDTEGSVNILGTTFDDQQADTLRFLFDLEYALLMSIVNDEAPSSSTATSSSVFTVPDQFAATPSNMPKTSPSFNDINLDMLQKRGYILAIPKEYLVQAQRSA